MSRPAETPPNVSDSVIRGVEFAGEPLAAIACLAYVDSQQCTRLVQSSDDMVRSSLVMLELAKREC